MREIDSHGLMVDGHDTSRADVLAQARQFLLDAGGHHLEVDERLATARVSRTWWTKKAGFVQEGHPGAAPVTVVSV